MGDNLWAGYQYDWRTFGLVITVGAGYQYDWGAFEWVITFCADYQL